MGKIDIVPDDMDRFIGMVLWDVQNNALPIIEAKEEINQWALKKAMDCKPQIRNTIKNIVDSPIGARECSIYDGSYNIAIKDFINNLRKAFGDNSA